MRRAPITRPLYRLEVYLDELRHETRGLQDGELTVGRGPENGLVLAGNRISRHHCRLQVEGEQVRVEDLDSANGTFLNGSPVEKASLHPGDLVEVGDFRLELHSASQEELSVLPDSRETIQLEAGVQPLVVDDPRHELGIFLSLIEDLDFEEAPQRIRERILEGLLTAMDAERAFLFRRDSRRGKIELVERFLLSDADASLPVSESLVLEALERRELCLVSGLPDRPPEGLPSVDRLAGEDVRSVMVVPLVAGRRLAGALYLDSRRSRRNFTREDLTLLARSGSYLSGIVLSRTPTSDCEARTRAWRGACNAQPVASPSRNSSPAPARCKRP